MDDIRFSTRETIVAHSIRLSINFFGKDIAREEVIFLFEDSVEGGYTAKGLGVSIFTEANTMEELREAVKDAVHCHFDNSDVIDQ